MLQTLSDRLFVHIHLFKNLIRNPKFWIVVCTDILLLAIAHCLAYEVRFDFDIPQPYFQRLINLLPLILLIKIPSFYLFGLYRGMWRYTSFHDVINILTATLFSSSILTILLLFGNRFFGFSRSVFILDCLFTLFLITLHRVLIRYLYLKYNPSDRLIPKKTFREKKRLLLLGCGDAAERVLRELQENHSLPYVAVGLLDDDPQKTGLKLHGIPVIGLPVDLEEHIRRTKAQEILIATVAADKTRMRSLVSLCQQTQLPYKILPNMGELINGKVSITTIRDISYKDLLGREEVHLEQDKIGSYLIGKTVLITGAGGSIGSELCRQILRFPPKLIILFDAGEENLYNVQMELRHNHADIKTVAILGKVQDIRLLKMVFKKYKPEVIFHTAAYKHVPLVERNPWQAVYNNIFATQLLMEAAIVFNVARFVLVSTDKAVRPTNVMGASKRVTELLMLAYSNLCWDGSLSPPWQQLQDLPHTELTLPPPQRNHGTRFMGVRFGNVLGSSGSVIPLFKRQIEKGGPITITHPEVTRYFMSAEEAAQLILQTGSMGEGGEIFLLKMGDPIKIDQMARELITLTGREPGIDIEIRYIGLRPGEKLYEELITQGEGIANTHHEKIMVLKAEKMIACQPIQKRLELLAIYAKELDSAGIKKTLKEIVPEYMPDYSA
ncbi:MAG: polysaccharide biosynthesis protein [Desulfobulbus sp.]